MLGVSKQIWVFNKNYRMGVKAMKKLKKYFFSKLTKLHKRNSDRPQMYNLKGITSDGKVVDFPYISADKGGPERVKNFIRSFYLNDY